MSWIYGMIVILIQLSSKSTIRNQHVVSATPLLQGKNIVDTSRIYVHVVLLPWDCDSCIVFLNLNLVRMYGSDVYLRDIDVIPSTRQVFLTRFDVFIFPIVTRDGWIYLVTCLDLTLRRRFFREGIETKKIIRKVRWILITKLPKKMRKTSSREIPSRR